MVYAASPGPLRICRRRPKTTVFRHSFLKFFPGGHDPANFPASARDPPRQSLIGHRPHHGPRAHAIYKGIETGRDTRFVRRNKQPIPSSGRPLGLAPPQTAPTKPGALLTIPPPKNGPKPNGSFERRPGTHMRSTPSRAPRQQIIFSYSGPALARARFAFLNTLGSSWDENAGGNREQGTFEENFSLPAAESRLPFAFMLAFFSMVDHCRIWKNGAKIPPRLMLAKIPSKPKTLGTYTRLTAAPILEKNP